MAGLLPKPWKLLTHELQNSDNHYYVKNLVYKLVTIKEQRVCDQILGNDNTGSHMIV